MANVTISQIANEVTSPAADDWIEIEENSTGTSGKIKKSNLLGALLTGGGVLATGGFTLTVPATGTGALKTGTPTADNLASWDDSNTLQDVGYAASDVARRSQANTFAALITASSGVTFGDETLDEYDEGTWTPTEDNITFASAEGHYTRIGNLVYFRLDVTWPNTADTNSISISGLPFTVAHSSGLAISFAGSSTPKYAGAEAASGGRVRVRDNSYAALGNDDMSETRLVCAGTYLTS